MSQLSTTAQLTKALDDDQSHATLDDVVFLLWPLLDPLAHAVLFFTSRTLQALVLRLARSCTALLNVQYDTHTPDSFTRTFQTVHAANVPIKLRLQLPSWERSYTGQPKPEPAVNLPLAVMGAVRDLEISTASRYCDIPTSVLTTILSSATTALRLRLQGFMGTSEQGFCHILAPFVSQYTELDVTNTMTASVDSLRILFSASPAPAAPNLRYLGFPAVFYDPYLQLINQHAPSLQHLHLWALPKEGTVHVPLPASLTAVTFQAVNDNLYLFVSDFEDGTDLRNIHKIPSSVTQVVWDNHYGEGLSVSQGEVDCAPAVLTAARRLTSIVTEKPFRWYIINPLSEDIDPAALGQWLEVATALPKLDGLLLQGGRMTEAALETLRQHMPQQLAEFWCYVQWQQDSDAVVLFSMLPRSCVKVTCMFNQLPAEGTPELQQRMDQLRDFLSKVPTDRSKVQPLSVEVVYFDMEGDVCQSVADVLSSVAVPPHVTCEYRLQAKKAESDDRSGGEEGSWADGGEGEEESSGDGSEEQEEAGEEEGTGSKGASDREGQGSGSQGNSGSETGSEEEEQEGEEEGPGSEGASSGQEGVAAEEGGEQGGDE